MLLDKKDRAILQVLDNDVRSSLTQIGKKTRLSKEVVLYRLKRLEEKKVITGYWSLINIQKGHTYKLLIKNQTLAGEKKKEFITFVSKHKAVSWFASTEGAYDFIITIYAKNEAEVSKFITETLTKYSKYFRERKLIKSIGVSMTNEKYLVDGKFLYQYKMDFIGGIVPKDKTEEKMITLLSGNARASFTEIGKKVKLTPEAISYRFRDILKKQLIKGFKIRIDFSKLGQSYYHLFLTIKDQSKKKELFDYYLVHPYVNSFMQHLGSYDAHLELVMPSEKTEEFMNELLLKFGNILDQYELLHIRKEHVLNLLK